MYKACCTTPWILLNAIRRRRAMANLVFCIRILRAETRVRPYNLTYTYWTFTLCSSETVGIFPPRCRYSMIDATANFFTLFGRLFRWVKQFPIKILIAKIVTSSSQAGGARHFADSNDGWYLMIMNGCSSHFPASFRSIIRSGQLSRHFAV